MRVPQHLIDLANYILEKKEEPIRFQEIDLGDDGYSRARGTVEVSVMVTTMKVDLEISFFARTIDKGRLLCENISIESASTGLKAAAVNAAISKLRDDILLDIKQDVLPFGIVIDVQ
jgi:hypothetical protein